MEGVGGLCQGGKEGRRELRAEGSEEGGTYLEREGLIGTYVHQVVSIRLRSAHARLSPLTRNEHATAC